MGAQQYTCSRTVNCNMYNDVTLRSICLTYCGWRPGLHGAQWQPQASSAYLLAAHASAWIHIDASGTKKACKGCCV